MRKTKNAAITTLVLLSVMLCGAAEAGKESLPGVYHLLFAAPKADCNGDTDGTAVIDSCGICVGGNTGKTACIIFSALNDTGITWGGSYPAGNNGGCTGEEIGAQDCSHGRDATHNDPSDGHAGFSFTKLDANGNPLANQAADYATTSWACVQDNVTGLVWEMKTADGGLHDQNDSYFWYNTDPATNGGAVGYADPGNTCEGYVAGQPSTYCNTQAYVARVNAAGWCGRNDWRMPSRTELQGIVSYGRVAPAIDTAYFPNTPSGGFWSGSPGAPNLAEASDLAWCVEFGNGLSDHPVRNVNYQVRLVRGGQ